VSTDSCGGIFVWSLNNGISLSQTLNIHSPPLALHASAVDSDSAVVAASQSTNKTSIIPPTNGVGGGGLSPSSSRPISPQSMHQLHEEEKTLTNGSGGGGNLSKGNGVVLCPEKLTVKAATIREIPPVLGYSLVAFCPPNNGVFTTSTAALEASSSSSQANSFSSSSSTSSHSSSNNNHNNHGGASIINNANGTLNEDEVDLSGESNAIAKSKLKAGYALSVDEDGVGGGGLDMSCLVLGVRTRILDALAFK
jgi:hypothetical protein